MAVLLSVGARHHDSTVRNLPGAAAEPSPVESSALCDADADPETVRQRVAAGDVVAQRMLEDFTFERIEPQMPDNLLELWTRGAGAYDRYQREFVTSGVLSAAAKAELGVAAAALTDLARYSLGAQRDFMLIGRLQDVYGPLTRDAEHAAAAAHWSVQRAVSQQCVDSYATDEGSETTCWNAAVSSAIMYYRRAGDAQRAENTLKLARQHPRAATQYERVEQVPLVFIRPEPPLRAQPFWPPLDFALVRSLEAAFKTPQSRATIDAELTALIGGDDLRRLHSPVAPLDPGSDEADAVGAGAWSELALYDGREWNEEACARVPTLVGLLRDDGHAMAGVCRAPPPDAPPSTPNLCGTAVVVTVLRLAAGATVLPHCGVTNRRLIMQFALRGSDGVEFIVGGEARGYGGDGHAIVFDDSFEHQVNHRGPEDRYVFFAILKHPDVADGAYG